MPCYKKILLLIFLLQAVLAHGEVGMNKSVDFDVAWGGYYATFSEDEQNVSIFRLLDFNRNAYHVALFSEKFDSIPSENEIKKLSPSIGHVPIDSKGLLNFDKIVLITTKDLTEQDLAGYMYYLESFEVPDNERDELMRSLIAFCKEPPIKLNLYIDNGELKLRDRK